LFISLTSIDSVEIDYKPKDLSFVKEKMDPLIQAERERRENSS